MQLSYGLAADDARSVYLYGITHDAHACVGFAEKL